MCVHRLDRDTQTLRLSSVPGFAFAFSRSPCSSPLSPSLPLLFLFSSSCVPDAGNPGKQTRVRTTTPVRRRFELATPRKLIRWNLDQGSPAFLSLRLRQKNRGRKSLAPTPNAHDFQDSTVSFQINLLLEAIF